MKKELQPLSVFTEDNLIWIAQTLNGGDHGVGITPAQVPILIDWLQEAVKELEADAAF